MADSHPTSDLVVLHERCSAGAADLADQLARLAPYAMSHSSHNVAVFRQAWSHIGAAAAVLRQLLP